MVSRNKITITTETLPLASERAQGVKGCPYTLRVAGFIENSVLTSERSVIKGLGLITLIHRRVCSSHGITIDDWYVVVNARWKDTQAISAAASFCQSMHAQIENRVLHLIDKNAVKGLDSQDFCDCVNSIWNLFAASYSFVDDARCAVPRSEANHVIVSESLW